IAKPNRYIQSRVPGFFPPPIFSKQLLFSLVFGQRDKKLSEIIGELDIKICAVYNLISFVGRIPKYVGGNLGDRMSIKVYKQGH
ncbi:hypothetical protein EG68_04520, partial [Paragonimus skrjabini miyazakii]